MESQSRTFLFKDLEEATDNFSVDNLIGKFQFGELYKGVIDGRDVTVKKWAGLDTRQPANVDIESRFRHEISLLQTLDDRHYPTLVELFGYCDEGEKKFCTVFNLNTRDSLFNIGRKDELNWLQRMKVIIAVGFFLEAMHDNEGGKSQYVLRNCDPKHIILDQDYNPKVVDLNMVPVGGFPEKPAQFRWCDLECFRFADESVFDDGWSEKVDVFSFGILILFLIAKLSYFQGHDIVVWACQQYNDAEKFKAGSRGYACPKSFINLANKNRFQEEVGYYHCDSRILLKLAMSCLDQPQTKRPTMKTVVDDLKNLKVARLFPDILNIDC